MARSVIFDLIARDKTSPALNEASRASERLAGNLRTLDRTQANPKVGLDKGAADRAIAALQGSLAKLQARRVEVPVHLQRVDTQINDLSSRLRELQAKRTTVSVDMRGEVDRQIKAVKAELTDLERRRVRIPLELGDVNADIAHVTSQLGQLRGQAQAAAPPLRNVGDELDKLAVRSQRLQTASGQFGGLFKFQAVAAGATLLGGAVGSLTAGMTALVSAAAPAAGALAVFPALLGAAAQGAGTVKLAFSGVQTALVANAAAEAQSAQAATAAAAKRQAAAQQVASARTAVSRAVEAATRTEENGDRRVAAAEADLAAAQRATRSAQQDLTIARREGSEQLRDLAFQAKGAALAEEGAELALARARERQAEVNRNAKASALERREASFAVREAELRLAEATDRARTATQENQAAQKAGVNGTPAVVTASERLREARAKEKSAAQDVSLATRDAARANKDAAAAVQAAAAGLVVAQKQAADSANTSTAAQQKAAAAMAALSPAGRTFVRFVQDELKPALDAGREASERGLFPGLTAGIRSMLPLVPMVNQALGETGRVIGELARRGGEMMSSGPWRRDFATILSANVGLLRTMGDAALPLANIVRNIWVAALPLAERFAGWVRSSAERIAALTQQARDSGALGRFFQLAGDTAAQLGRIVGNVAASLVNVGRAAFDSGRILMTSLEGATARMREFSGSTAGAQRLREYFQNAVPVMKETGRLVGAVTLGVARLGENQALAPLIRQVREELLPAFGRLMSGVSTQFGPLLVQLATRVVDIFARLTAGGGGLNAFVGTLNNMAGAFQRLLASPLGPVVRDLLAVAGTAAALGLVAGAVGRLTSSIALLGGGAIKAITALVKFRGSMAALNVVMIANPVGAVVTAVAALAGGFVLAWRNSETFRDTVKRSFAVVGLAVADTADKYAGFLTALGRVPGFGWATDAARDLYVFSAAARDSSIATLASSVATDKANDSLSGVPGEADPARRSLDDLKAAEDRLKGATQDVVTQLNIFKGAAGDTTAASDGWKAALDRVRESVRENGNTLDDHSDKGRANRQVIRDAASALQAKMEADFKETAATGALSEATRQATETFEKNRKKLIDVAVQSGLTRKDAERYAAQLLKTPAEVKTAIDTPGMREAQRQVDSLKRKIGDVPNAKGVHVTTSAQYIAGHRISRGGSGGVTEADGGVLDFYARGGLRENHVAQIARPGAWRVWAEPETGGEAYIPLAPSKRARSREVAQEAVKRLGGVARFADGGIHGVGCGCGQHAGALTVPGKGERGRYGAAMSQSRYNKLLKDRVISFTGDDWPGASLRSAVANWQGVADVDIRHGTGPNKVLSRWVTGKTTAGKGALGRYVEFEDYPAIFGYAESNWARGYKKFHTMNHEIGHALSLSHDRTSGSLMHPFQQRYSSFTGPQTRDKARLRAAFPDRGDKQGTRGKPGLVGLVLKLLGVSFPGSYTGTISGAGDRIQQQYAATLAVAGNMAIQARNDKVGGGPRGGPPGRPTNIGNLKGRRGAYGGVLPHVAAVGDLVNGKFGPFPGGIGGFNYRKIAGTNIVSDHGKGKALDFMTLGNKALGQRVADFLVANRAKLKTDNVIWNRQITNAGRGWRWGRYSGANPHTDHPHWDTYANGGVIDEPIIGRGTRTGRMKLLGENGPEMVLPIQRGGVSSSLSKADVALLVRAAVSEALREAPPAITVTHNSERASASDIVDAAFHRARVARMGGRRP